MLVLVLVLVVVVLLLLLRWTWRRGWLLHHNNRRPHLLAQVCLQGQLATRGQHPMAEPLLVRLTHAATAAAAAAVQRGKHAQVIAGVENGA